VGHTSHSSPPPGERPISNPTPAVASAHQLVAPEPPAAAGFNLTEIHKLLTRHLPADQVPSLITLRRHAKDKLVRHIVPGTVRRPKFYWGRVKAFYAARARPAKVRQTSAGEGGYTDEQLARVLGSILEPVLVQLLDVTKQVAALPAVHKALMNKYDGATNLAQARAAAAEERLAAERKNSDINASLMRLTVAVARLAEK
jgi:hypothetical protein